MGQPEGEVCTLLEMDTADRPWGTQVRGPALSPKHTHRVFFGEGRTEPSRDRNSEDPVGSSAESVRATVTTLNHLMTVSP